MRKKYSSTCPGEPVRPLGKTHLFITYSGVYPLLVVVVEYNMRAENMRPLQNDNCKIHRVLVLFRTNQMLYQGDQIHRETSYTLSFTKL